MVVVVLAAAAVIIATHKSSSPSASSGGNTTTDVWTYHDLDGHTVKVVPSADVVFVASNGTRVPELVQKIDVARARHDCAAIFYVYVGGQGIRQDLDEA